VKRTQRLYIQDVIDNIDKIFTFTHGLSKEAFLSNEMATYAVTRAFEIIGEASNNIDKDTQRQNPHIMWRNIVSFRNFIIHEYSGLDLTIVWKTIHEDLPETRIQFEALYNTELQKEKASND
jgi:uncharacterized protein with HEPN domain